MTTRRVPRAWRPLFGRVRLVERWDGETARYARFESERGALFVKYRYADDFDARAYRRFVRERAYLQNFAPHVSVPHAPLLHAAEDDRSFKAHLVLRDLAGETRSWGDLGERERVSRLGDVMALVARFHGEWATSPRLREHPSFPWTPEDAARTARARLARKPDVALPSRVERLAAHLQAPGVLEALLGEATTTTLTHGDLHFGQVLFGEEKLYLLDFQQVRAAPLGADLAHLLGLRLSFVERLALQERVLDAYAAAAAEWDVRPDFGAEVRVGAALNFVSMWRRATHEPSAKFRELLVRVGELLLDFGVKA